VPSGLLAQNGITDLPGRLSPKDRSSSGHFVEHRAKTEEVRAYVGMGVVYKAEDVKLHRFVARRSAWLRSTTPITISAVSIKL
jgi:hypothetical protein